MDVLEAIITRRSIRHYKSEPVREQDLNTVLEAAQWAPSWGNTQCWRFVVVTDVETKSKLAQTLDPGNRGIAVISQAPVLLVACAELGMSGYRHGEFGSDKGDWFMFDVALAMQNLTLAAHNLGLGTLHIGWFDAQKAARIVNLPPGIVVVEMMTLGYPERETKPPFRKNLADFVFYNSYGSSSPQK